MQIKKKEINFYKKNGYVKIFLFNSNDILSFKKTILKDLNTKLKGKSKIKIKNLKDYHKLKIDENIHKFLINPDHRYFKFSKKIKKKILNKTILSLINYEWGHSKISLNWIGNLKKKQKIINATGYRIARPFVKKKKDTAGVHIDVNAGGIINRDLKTSLTIWIPIVGFSKKYTLKISPKSHLFDHGVKFKITKKKVTPLLEKKYWKKFKFTRLNLKPGQAIIFHPNLLHGGSNNFGSSTRVSLDTRILNLKRFKY